MYLTSWEQLPQLEKGKYCALNRLEVYLTTIRVQNMASVIIGTIIILSRLELITINAFKFLESIAFDKYHRK